MNREVMVFRDARRLAECARDIWGDVCRTSSEAGYFRAVLSGGETPIPLYQSLAEEGVSCSWDATHIYFADERFVPFDHPDSNYGAIRKVLLDKVPLRPSQVHPVPVEGSPEAAAIRYEQEIRAEFGLPDGKPSFDLAVLGIGEDGHTASLFPGTPVLREKRWIAAPVFPETAAHARITLTFPVLNKCRTVMFIVTGRKKAAVLAGTLAGEPGIPAVRVRPRGRLFYLLDDAAASAWKRTGVETGEAV